MDNRDLDSIFDEDSGGSNQGSQAGGNVVANPNIEPVKLGRLATTGILVVGIIIVMILLVTIKSCSIEKKENVNSDNTQYSENIENSSNSSYDVSSTLSELNYSEEKSGTVTSEQVDPTENTVSTEELQGGLTEKVSITLSDVIESRGMVIGKHCYLYDDSYIYGLTISVLIDGDAETLQYFCPRKTYDALESMDSVNVMYQFDSNGNYSIYSISKD